MATSNTPCLEHVRVTTLPRTAFYLANFISPDEERVLLDKITNAPKPRWKQLTHRRLQTWPSDLQRDTLLESSLPAWLTHPVIGRLTQLPLHHSTRDHIFSASPHQTPNHVLINEYAPGQGIMPHEDGSAYYPVVCTVSLGASLCLDLYPQDDTDRREPTFRILQEPRSLLITTDDLYTQYLHGIADVDEDVNLRPDTVANWDLLGDPERFRSGRNVRATRTSLTYRDVLKVSKLGNKLSLFGRR